MNPDSPKTPQEEMETRLLALLLGELPEEEAAAWDAAIATNPELAKLHDRLKQTVNLVREAAIIPTESKSSQAAPLQLSEERRKNLLARFMIPPFKEDDRKPKPKLQFRLIEVLVVVTVIGALAAMLLPTLSSSKSRGFRTGVSQVDALAAGRAATELLRTDAQVVSGGGGSTNVNSLKVVGYVERVLPPQSTRGDSRLSINPLLPAEPPLAAMPARPPSQRSQIVLPSEANSESAGANRGTEVALGNNHSWDVRPSLRGFYDDKNGKTPTGAPPAPVAGDPAWTGLLEKPGSQNPNVGFLGRYAYAVPNEGKGVSPSTGVPLDNNFVDGATLGQTLTVVPEQDAFRKRYGLSAANSTGGGMGGGGGARGGGLSAGGVAISPQPNAGQQTRGDSLAEFAYIPAPAAPPPLQTPPPLSAPVAAPIDDLGEKATVLGDLPALGKAFRSQSRASERAGREVTSPAQTTASTQDDRMTFYRQLSQLGTDSGIASTNSLNLAYKNDWSRDKSGADALTTFGVIADADGLGRSDSPQQQQKLGDVRLADGSIRELSRSKLQEVLRNSGSTISGGGRVAAEPSVLGFDAQDLAKTPTTSESGVAATAENGVRQQRGASIVLPQVEQEIAGVPAIETGRAETLTRGRAVPARPLRASESEIAGKPTSTVAPAQAGEQLWAEDRLNNTVEARPMSGSRMPSDAARRRVAADKKENADVMVQVTDGRVLLEAGKLDAIKADPENRAATSGALPTASGATAERSRSYQEAKLRLEELQGFQRLLNLKMSSEKLDVALPRSALVKVIDRAEPPSAPRQSLWERISGAEGKYKSSTRVKIERDSSEIEGLTKPNSGGNYDPYFVQSELETIQSEAILGRVAEQLKLNEAWAKKHGGGKLKTSEAVSFLKEKIELRPVPNTSLVEIRAKSDDPNEAAKIANTVAGVYHDYRLGEGRQLAQAGIETLKKQFDEQEKKVREAQKEVERLQKEIEVEPDVVVPRQSATNAPIPQSEIQTSENAFSTFSLNVSDVSFKLAAASLEKGQMPDAASVRTEEFINAFDYRDPEPTPGAPIAFAWERARYPFAHNRDLLRFSLKTAAAGRQAGRPLNIVLLLDNSGSMERADRVRIIREALRVLASQLQPQDKLSVITFARTPRLVADGISGDKAGEVAEAVSGLTPQGGTNLEDAMNLAYQTAVRHYLAKGMNRVVLLTDGAANLGDVEPDSLKQKVEAQRKQGIALDCFGIGWEGFNDDLLEVLSRNGDGRYGFINSPEEAATEFAGQLAGALKVAASDVKVQVEFNPRRVTSYRQIGYAKHQLMKEQFRDNTVDAAEIAVQEAGNALYTVEVNPAGEGPLCTVRVRYKIPGTTDYREQAWDVPYTGNALSLEQASPAMRLAASASAFSEWLVASPFAAEVTPDRVLGYLGGVPEIYGADARPKKLEWMVRQAKSLQGK